MKHVALAGVGLTGMAAVVWSSTSAYDLAEPRLPGGRLLAAELPPVTWALAMEQASYQRDVEYQLAAHRQRLARLEREAAEATPQAREALQLESAIADFARRLADAQAALNRLRQSGESSWLTHRIATEEALQSLRHAHAAG